MPTYAEMQKLIKQRQKEREPFEEHLRELRRQELAKQGLKLIETNELEQKDFHGDCDSPSTMENSTATFFWILSLVVGAIFKGNWVIWIISTVIWARFITRHKKIKNNGENYE